MNCPKCGTPIQPGGSACCPTEKDGSHHSNHNCNARQKEQEKGRKK